MIRKLSLLSLIPVLILFACQTNPLKKIPPSELLKVRIEQYMEAQNKKNMEQLYPLYPPDYRKKVSLSEFTKQQPSPIIIEKIDSIDYKPGQNNATVHFTVKFNVMGFNVNHLSVPSNWQLVGGQWFLVPSEMTFKDLFRHGS